MWETKQIFLCILENKGMKLFQDSVHNVMRFHHLLVKFIDTREFQRLRNIKQLSTTYLVYPAAAHNRFEHCLGVCFLAGELLAHLERNSPTVWKSIFDSEKEIKHVKLAVQLAGLLHDVGHGPFSHTWEKFVHSCGIEWDHEDTSCSIIDIIIWKNDEREELTEVGEAFKEEFGDVKKYVEFIKDLIRGDKINYIMSKESSDSEKKRAFLYQVVANKINDVDVDKFDYFLRDAQHLNIGLPFNYQRLMNLCRIEILEDGISYIAFRDCESYSLKGLFRTRADLHVKAYQHRVAKCLEAMLVDALKSASDNDYKVGGCKLCHVQNSPRLFVRLTDSIQENILNSDEESLANARAILERILKRKLYETVKEWVLDVEQSEEEKRNNRPPAGLKKKKLLELEEKLEKKCAISQVCVNQGKFYEPMRNMKFFAKHGSDEIVGKNTPSIVMDLPFYKIYVFKRVQDGCDNLKIIRTVEEFLIKENVFKEKPGDR
ncbi:Deoxynucleoside triphosphate triphosphohydrolase SAMHD1 [Frankliniella fusca]|uniref:Deoxynucleoside triphosphate triphosphohydrolase SAMHD1 n=1 Tax=Frankliniella fusca TaxID=407009 RepID=A0AAE1HW19_9NEOP|nr:Deoxynucleoside triphosphate triphosphohydrolase SAMHD1 [Frankliniella fusca]